MIYMQYDFATYGSIRSFYIFFSMNSSYFFIFYAKKYIVVTSFYEQFLLLFIFRDKRTQR